MDLVAAFFSLQSGAALSFHVDAVGADPVGILGGVTRVLSIVVHSACRCGLIGVARPFACIFTVCVQAVIKSIAYL